MKLFFLSRFMFGLAIFAQVSGLAVGTENIPFLDPSFPVADWLLATRGNEDMILDKLREEKGLRFAIIEEDPRQADESVLKENENLLSAGTSLETLQGYIKYYSSQWRTMEAFERSPTGRSGGVAGADFIVVPAAIFGQPNAELAGTTSKTNRLGGLTYFVSLVVAGSGRFEMIEEAAHYFWYKGLAKKRKSLAALEHSRSAAWKSVRGASENSLDYVRRWDGSKPPVGSALINVDRFLTAATLQTEFGLRTYAEEIAIALLMRAKATDLKFDDDKTQERLLAQVQKNINFLQGRILRPIHQALVYDKLNRDAALPSTREKIWGKLRADLVGIENQIRLAETAIKPDPAKAKRVVENAADF